MARQLLEGLDHGRVVRLRATVGADGVIIRSYDGVISPAELDAALTELE